ncbi:MAG: pseudouridine synthase, partial [bacterium]
MRLDKFLSNATDYSRSQIKKLLRSQCVTLNGDIESSAATVVNADDLVELEGVAIALPLPRYLMFNKPKGVVSATKDSDHPTAIDYLDEHRPEDLQIAGRLDIDATGLLLITDDGAWNHRVTSPNYRHD